MRILGIDPGYERVGFGVIESDSRQCYHAKDWGVITTSKNDSEANRLYDLQNALKELIDDVKPDVASLEKIFFFRNAKTMVPVCQARGVIIVALYAAGIPFGEYTPMQVKMNISGYGKSSKKEVQEMVKHIFVMDEIPQPDDAADALAIALSYAFEHESLQFLSVR